MQIESGKKVYFLSDFHLGIPDHSSSLKREKKIVDFLEKIKKETAVLFIVGDLFDFWFEYRKVIPKGYVRILGNSQSFQMLESRYIFLLGIMTCGCQAILKRN